MAAPSGRSWFSAFLRALPPRELTTEPIMHHTTWTLGWVRSTASAVPETRNLVDSLT